MTSQTKNIATIRVDRFYSHPPGKVWQALTEPALLARWWAPGDIAPIVGHRFTMDMGHWGKVPCRILEVELERRLVFTFGDEWTITWSLVEERGGTRMYLEHTGFDLDDPRARFAFENMGPGWRDEVLPRMDALLEASGGPRRAPGGAP